ncbi:hypothetical protein INR49_030108 [Caranx melampygus]|nr:hypothetical protein INR49_030108 [Caranx melampygus]
MCQCLCAFFFEFMPLLWCKCESIKDFAGGLVFYCVFLHCKLLKLFFFTSSFFFSFVFHQAVCEM